MAELSRCHIAHRGSECAEGDLAIRRASECQMPFLDEIEQVVIPSIHLDDTSSRQRPWRVVCPSSQAASSTPMPTNQKVLSQPFHQKPLRADRLEACSGITRSSFSGGIEGLPSANTVPPVPSNASNRRSVGSRSRPASTRPGSAAGRPFSDGPSPSQPLSSIWSMPKLTAETG